MIANIIFKTNPDLYIKQVNIYLSFISIDYIIISSFYMRCIISKSNNPYLNLATEEYFLKNSNEDIFMLYINGPCIVVGKHQNLLSEINTQFVHNNNITLARRISGGEIGRAHV